MNVRKRTNYNYTVTLHACLVEHIQEDRVQTQQRSIKTSAVKKQA